MRTMMRRTELGASTKVFFRVMSHPVKWARTVTANTKSGKITPLVRGKQLDTDAKKLIVSYLARGKRRKFGAGPHTDQQKIYPLQWHQSGSSLINQESKTPQSKAGHKMNKSKINFLCSLLNNRIARHASLDFIGSLTQEESDWMWAFEAHINQER